MGSPETVPAPQPTWSAAYVSVSADWRRRGSSIWGRPGLIEGTRELVEAPYIIVYRVDNEREEIVVLAIFHGAQNR